MAHLAVELAMRGEFGEARAHLSRVQALDGPGKLAFSCGAYLALLSGEAPVGSPAFERLLDDPRNSRFGRGQLCFMVGDVVRGCSYWQKLRGAGLSAATYYRVMFEHYFADGVVDHPDYQNMLDEIGAGRRWTAFLRECVKELAPVTGIELSTVEPTN